MAGRRDAIGAPIDQAIRAGRPVVLRLRTGSVLVSEGFLCEGYGATAAVLVVYTQLTG